MMTYRWWLWARSHDELEWAAPWVKTWLATSFLLDLFLQLAVHGGLNTAFRRCSLRVSSATSCLTSISVPSSGVESIGTVSFRSHLGHEVHSIFVFFCVCHSKWILRRRHQELDCSEACWWLRPIHRGETSLELISGCLSVHFASVLFLSINVNFFTGLNFCFWLTMPCRRNKIKPRVFLKRLALFQT